jgi:drug/metabolite transporter (DMT)-like permease
MLTFKVADIVQLGLMMALACVIGFAVGMLLRRLFKRNRPVDWVAYAFIGLGFWAFAMQATLIAELIDLADQPKWLKSLMYALLGIMALGVALSERRFSRRQATSSLEPISKPAPADAPKTT